MNKTIISILSIIALTCAACGAPFQSAFGEGGYGGGGTGGNATSTSANGGGGSGGSECEPSEEVCDGLDNDCDEEVDEDITDCVGVELEFYEDSNAMVLVVDGEGNTDLAQTTVDPVTDSHMVYLDGARTVYLRMEQPIVMVDAMDVTIDPATYGYGCSDGPIKATIEEMEADLASAAFSKGETLEQCNSVQVCTYTHTQGCQEDEVHIFSMDLAPAVE